MGRSSPADGGFDSGCGSSSPPEKRTVLGEVSVDDMLAVGRQNGRYDPRRGGCSQSKAGGEWEALGGCNGRQRDPDGELSLHRFTTKAVEPLPQPLQCEVPAG